MIPETLKQLSLKVSQYFLDFLESDFKRQQAPRRRVILQTTSGFKAGMPIAPYRKLQDVIWANLDKPWDATELAITPRAFTKELSQPLRLILKEQVAALSREPVEHAILAVVQQAKKSFAKALTHPEEWVSLVRQELADNIGSGIVRPMLTYLDTALRDHAYSSVDSVFSAEGDLIEALAQPLDEPLPEILARFSVSNDSAELMQAAVKLLSLDFIKSTISKFFESFAASDAFLEFRDLETYVSTSEGNQLYLYIGTIKYGSTTFPLFYLPLETRRDDQQGTYTVKFGNQLYANKRATDFILQEISASQQKQWLSPIPERITYLNSTDSILDVIRPMFARINKAFGFLDELRLSSGPISQQADTKVVLANSLHFCAFEKADEALLNDYEEMISQIRTDREGVVSLFQSMVEGVINGNPASIDAAIDQKWRDIPVEFRAVPDTPIPLNEEQQKVLEAIRHEDGRIIVVEGPPGTGKSHTIVAIAADCAFRKKSCLVLSDKPEALTVVHDKLSSAMNEVRGSEDFPNPLLRLGSEQANFRRLTSATTLTQVGAHVKATNANRASLEADRDHRRQTLRAQINTVIGAYGAIRMQDISLVEDLSQQLDRASNSHISSVIDRVDEVFDKELDFPIDVDLNRLESLIERILEAGTANTCASLFRLLNTYKVAAELYGEMQGSHLSECPSLKSTQVQKLMEVIGEVEATKKPIIGWLFAGKKLRTLSSKCQGISVFRKTISFPADLQLIESIVAAGHKLASSIAGKSDRKDSFDEVYGALASTEFPIPGLTEFQTFIKALARMPDNPEIQGLFGKSSTAAAKTWILSFKYAAKYHATRKQFDRAPPLEYVARKTEVEKLNTALMNAEVDSRLVAFMENSRTDAKVLAKLIKDRQKFPEEKFETVKQAFPVMIASIREFGEYMPLKKDLLDVLVIDEASQVSVAQAFPALLRAKKIVVMGDSNQFANTKASNASIELNQKHRGELEAFFRREVSQQADMVERLSYFDVKRSILEFGQLCANYRIMLRKHFRSYKELINYSSTTFYGGQLQAIKIRNIPLADCIEFNQVDPGNAPFPRNTNPAEAQYILERCAELLQERTPPTVGVITPFREQQSYISHVLSNHSKSAEFRTRLRIKVMTFDSCQGEERGIIFYSMVATSKADLLNYIFPVELKNAEEHVSEKLKMQRLNVGFSRAQEMVSFVLSKPLAEFKGSIGQALRHFDMMSRTHKALVDETDPLSPMEQKVLDWIYATPFYQSRSENVEVMPQFPLGDYLRQLDPSYKHPAWRVDFLLSIDTESDVVYVVVEYDGFEFHFKHGAPVTSGNHERYLNEADVERQLTLESYGYRFLRLNRFNLGRDPVSMLSERLEQIVLSASKADSTGTVRVIGQQANALTDKSAKACERCGQIKPLASFFDKKLGDGAGGTGRVCVTCKNGDKLQAGRPQRRRKWRR